jgi:cystathionine beta-lyase family protein involved in aluminum resistance
MPQLSLSVDLLEQQLSSQFSEVERVSYLNHKKVLNAFKQAKVSTEHFYPTTGYGHDDIGRDKLDELYSLVFGSEDALVRVGLVSGTHAISCAFLGNLNYGDDVLFITGKPYDTLESVLNYAREKMNVTMTFQKNLSWEDPDLMVELARKNLKENTKFIFFQRSCGYSSDRPSISVEFIGEVISQIKRINPNLICFVDNCYGEFVEEKEPTELGADLIAGSLIKNPGAGIVLTGGYIAGRRNLVKAASERLTCPGIGSEGGLNFGEGRLLFQGLYLAPHAVEQMVKSSLLLSVAFEECGLKTLPVSNSKRVDIIQKIEMGSREGLIDFCKLVQANSPVNSHLTPIPSETPGYSDEVIMAAGTFIEGATSEFSVDGPLREPFTAFIQGGLSYFYTKVFVENYLLKFKR